MEKVDMLEHFAAKIINKDPLFLEGFSKSRLPISNIEYMSSSRIKKLRESPKHYEWRYILGNYDKETPAKKLGKLIHWALLEPGEFKKRYRIIPKFSGTGMKRAKQDWLNDCPENAILLTEDEAQKVSNMIDALYSHQLAAKLLSNGTPEVHTYYRDHEFLDHQGLPIQWYGIIDFLRSGNKIIELKSTRCAKWYNFQRDCDSFGYHIQTFLYKRWVEGMTGKRPDNWMVAIENVEPYCVEVYEPDIRWYDQAYCDVRDALERYNNAKKSGHWPGYSDNPRKLSLPNYTYYRYEEELEQ